MKNVLIIETPSELVKVVKSIECTPEIFLSQDPRAIFLNPSEHPFEYMDTLYDEVECECTIVDVLRAWTIDKGVAIEVQP
jgi:hypothetical protein